MIWAVRKLGYQDDNFSNFTVMLLTENQLFSSSVGSDLQAMSIYLFPCSVNNVHVEVSW
jgi:hypothetical protein